MQTSSGLRCTRTADPSPRDRQPPTIHQESVEGSLEQASDRSHRNLLYQHPRSIRKFPIEDVAGAVKDLIQQARSGTSACLGSRSEDDPQGARRAPVTAVQSEYSIWWKPARRRKFCRRLRKWESLVPYSPLGRGFLAGRVTEKHAVFWTATTAALSPIVA